MVSPDFVIAEAKTMHSLGNLGSIIFGAGAVNERLPDEHHCPNRYQGAGIRIRLHDHFGEARDFEPSRQELGIGLELTG
jgi:hypothetical protein